MGARERAINLLAEHAFVPSYPGSPTGRCVVCHPEYLRDMMGTTAYRRHVVDVLAEAGLLAPDEWQVWIAEEQARSRAAEDRLRRVEALLASWEASEQEAPYYVRSLRAALVDEAVECRCDHGVLAHAKGLVPEDG